MRNKNVSTDLVYSQPTMCLGCHLTVILFHGREADLLKGYWQCPKCQRIYPFKFWKIRKATQKKVAKQKEETVIKAERTVPTWGEIWENRRRTRR